MSRSEVNLASAQGDAPPVCARDYAEGSGLPVAFRSRMRWVLPMPKAQTGLAESPFLPIILRAHLDGSRLTTSYNGFPIFRIQMNT